VTAALNIFTDWGGGYCATIRVMNGAATPTTGWTVGLNLNQSSIYTSWNGLFSGSSGGISIAPGFAWNCVIAAGATNDSVGFCANRNVPGSGTLPILLGASGT
jgi:cellulase/cellobiase CelA1